MPNFAMGLQLFRPRVSPLGQLFVFAIHRENSCLGECQPGAELNRIATSKYRILLLRYRTLNKVSGLFNHNLAQLSVLRMFIKKDKKGIKQISRWRSITLDT
jgi:hypothetical protein